MLALLNERRNAPACFSFVLLNNHYSKIKVEYGARSLDSELRVFVVKGFSWNWVVSRNKLTRGKWKGPWLSYRFSHICLSPSTAHVRSKSTVQVHRYLSLLSWRHRIARRMLSNRSLVKIVWCKRFLAWKGVWCKRVLGVKIVWCEIFLVSQVVNAEAVKGCLVSKCLLCLL